jgi:hypothetical protein|tara:strand:- start:2493 stop:4715 length:2223 start_codon:yes stop_codon:yes gene_type:complete
MNVVWGYRFYPKILFISIMLVTIVTACIMIYEQGSAVGIPASVVVGIPSGYGLERDTDAYNGPHPGNLTRPDDTFSYPIELGEVGPVQSLFAGPLQYPFLCRITESELGQPLVDNHEGIGVAVYDDEMREVIGYSQDCLIPSRAEYYYVPKGETGFRRLEDLDGEIEKITLGSRRVDFVVRLEIGVINRFLYGIAVLRGPDEQLSRPDSSYWNRRLIYQFRGGVGVGHRQGKLRPKDLLKRRFEQLKLGYAVVYSTGNQTSNHYNIWLAEDTALRAKRQFASLYGEPLYTVGIGGSGGAIQQYLLAQNNPEVLDGIIPLYSYPDMVTQATPAIDCELMENYFDHSANAKWSDWDKREWIEGMHAQKWARNHYAEIDLFARLASVRMPRWSIGLTECVNGWRGLTPLIANPATIHYARRFTPQVAQAVHWTYWDDLKQFYGVDADGFARRTWDNVGVQYGLAALLEGKVDIEEFTDLNARIGGWKPAPEMQVSRFWYLAGDPDPEKFDVWDSHNITPLGEDEIAARSSGDVSAMQAAYRSGNVFIGNVTLPIIDLRHYLDDELDMHHSYASFSARLRIVRAMGEAGNHIIWMARKPYNPQSQAFELMDRWMLNIKLYPGKSVLENRPFDAVDRCYGDAGEAIAEGEGVWDGAWNGQPDGACMRSYPAFQGPRMVAGAGRGGDMLKCQLMPVQEAIDRMLYGELDMSSYKERLEAIFPDGVCDYSKPDLARPADLLLRRGSG